MARFQPTVTLGVSFQNKQDMPLPSLDYLFLSLKSVSQEDGEKFCLTPSF